MVGIKKVLPKIDSMPFNMQIVKFSKNLALLHSKMALNTTSLARVATPCVNWTLMGLATFVVPHLSCNATFGLTNKCVVP